jgi:hypothetical protein
MDIDARHRYHRSNAALFPDFAHVSCAPGAGLVIGNQASNAAAAIIKYLDVIKACCFHDRL